MSERTLAHELGIEGLRAFLATEGTGHTLLAHLGVAIHELGLTVAASTVELPRSADAPLSAAADETDRPARVATVRALRQEVQDHLADEDDRATLLQADALLKRAQALMAALEWAILRGADPVQFWARGADTKGRRRPR